MRRWLERQRPAIVLATGLVLSACAGWLTWRAIHAQQVLRIENASDRAHAAIDSRIDAYVAILRGAAGFFAGSDDVTRQDFRAYAERLELRAHYPGIQGLGYSAFLTAADADRVTAGAARDGITDFHLWRLDGDWMTAARAHAGGHAILYLEPLDKRNRAALGLDMSSEPVRREAMDHARDTGEPTASGRVRLVQEITPGDEQAGFLVYFPLYARDAAPKSVEQRRAAFRGFAYAAFRADDLLRGILGPATASELRVEVYDGGVEEPRLLHRSESAAGKSPRTLRYTTVAGRQWTLVFEPSVNYPNAHEFASATITALAGAVIATLLFLVLRREVRARELAEQQADGLRRSESTLRELARQKDEFLTVISHELRTPLNAIMGWTAMLRRDQLADAQRARALEIIQRNAAAQAHLVDDLLDASRAISGRVRISPVTLDVGAVLEAAVDSMGPLAAAGGVTLTWKNPGSLGTIVADATRLQQVVGNLLANAVKFTPPGGHVALDAHRGPAELTIRVSDTGIGMDAEFLPYAFDRFRQANTSTTRTHGGVGLGLSIARTLVELHGGRIEAFSDGIGRGATFVVTLPAGPAA